MQDLSKVNQLLVALGASPVPIREDFPYESAIYPFPFNLEPLSIVSLAKHVWTESPPGAIDILKALAPEDRQFCRDIDFVLEINYQPNDIRSLYDSLINILEKLGESGESGLPDMHPSISVMHVIKSQGEVDHFHFFKSLFTCSYDGFGGDYDAWSRPALDPLYPAHQLQVNPRAYVGHDGQIEDPELLNLAWLGNLHYWILLTLLSAGYSTGSAAHIGLARAHMMGPFWALARKLSVSGAGMLFDPLSIGYACGSTRQTNELLLSRLLTEADMLEKRLLATLPIDFPADCCRSTLSTLSRVELKVRLARARSFPWDDGLASVHVLVIDRFFLRARQTHRRPVQLGQMAPKSHSHHAQQLAKRAARKSLRRVIARRTAMEQAHLLRNFVVPDQWTEEHQLSPRMFHPPRIRDVSSRKLGNASFLIGSQDLSLN